jgi:hypothetical protein
VKRFTTTDRINGRNGKIKGDSLGCGFGSAIRTGVCGGGGGLRVHPLRWRWVWRASTVLYCIQVTLKLQADRFALVLVLGCGGPAHHVRWVTGQKGVVEACVSVDRMSMDEHVDDYLHMGFFKLFLLFDFQLVFTSQTCITLNKTHGVRRAEISVTICMDNRESLYRKA